MTTKTLKKISSAEIDKLMDGDGYAEYIMENSDKPCGNGDMLINLMESGELYEAYLESLGFEEGDD